MRKERLEELMARRIVVTSQKGGVGKTTVSLHLALALAERGKSTLLVDLDPQGGIGHSLARGDTELAGLTDRLMGAVSAEKALLETKVPGLSLLPRGRLDPIDVIEYERAIQAPGVLDEALRELEGGFERVILDTPSGLGMVTRGALAVADYALIPFQASALALRSVSQVLRVIEHVRATENPKLSLLGILPTMVERDSEPSQAVLVDIWTGFAGVLETIIPLAPVFGKASRTGLPIGFLGGRPSPEARRFDALAAEVESIICANSPKEEQDVEQQERQLL